MNRGVRIFIVASLLAAAAAGAHFWRGSRGPRVDGVHAVRQPLTETLLTSGRVVQRGSAELGSTLQGTVVEVPVEEGAHVEPEQLLVRLADEEARAAVAEAEASVAEAEAQLRRVRGAGRRLARQSLERARIDADRAQAELDRQARLFDVGAVTEAQLDHARRERDSARSRRVSATLDAAEAAPRGSDTQLAAAALARAQARLRSAEATLNRTQIRAPSAGVVLTRHVEPGEVVRPGDLLVSFSGDGPLEVEVQPDESNLGRLSEGLDALVSPAPFPERRIAAEVVRIAPAVDASRGSVTVHLSLEDVDGLRPDMTVTVEIAMGQTDEALVLPAAFIRDLGTERPWVLIVEDGTAARREVRLGLEGDTLVEVSEGLDQETVVLGPDTNVEPGATVRVRRVEPAVR